MDDKCTASGVKTEELEAQHPVRSAASSGPGDGTGVVGSWLSMAHQGQFTISINMLLRHIAGTPLELPKSASGNAAYRAAFSEAILVKMRGGRQSVLPCHVSAQRKHVIPMNTCTCDT